MTIYDISLTISPALPTWPGDPGLELEQFEAMDSGAHVNVTRISSSVHIGTHVDAPHHFLNDGRTVESLPLDVLTGPCYSFTGYLLPWDQLAYWAVTVGTNIAASVPWVGPQVRELMIGGRNIDQAPLIRFYVLHVILLPGALGVLFAYHMWRIRKDGGLARVDRVATLREKAAEEPVKTKTYTQLGVARGTAPAIRAASLEARDLTVNAVPDLVRRAAVSALGPLP